ncbi:T9SS type A sorting domain-containing protein [Hymenobacter sp. BT683]|uniref:T9SS type A sorting domain-containing protein n=1 Tax=Hymenobacter jeongseonensis TaxID=2791027 RepID=A0ABS0INL8_9BACT|nr:T9SS type A sorting domain-containing protein [Hymenobacter jeongseonensis]MBF9239969.1 T9SS type A sorting domain-containing protein [Hymenobacter jeongseonensis]
MRHHYWLLLLLLTGALRSVAQSTLQFTVSQAPTLVVDAGPDQTIRPAERVVLGGPTPATGGAGPYVYAWTPVTGLSRPDVARPTASPTQTTVYTLAVNQAGGCQKVDQVTVTVATVTAAHPGPDRFGLRLYPNPTRGAFTLASDVSLGAGTVHLAVYSGLGQLLYTESLPASSQKLERLIAMPPPAAGLYFVRLTGRDVNRVFHLQVR